MFVCSDRYLERLWNSPSCPELGSVPRGLFSLLLARVLDFHRVLVQSCRY